MNILSLWPYLTTDRGVLSSRGFEITGALMITRCIDWLPKKFKKCKADIWGEFSRHPSQEDADGQAGGWVRMIAPDSAPERQEGNEI